MLRPYLLAAATLFVTLLAQPVHAQSAGDPAKGETVFKKCRICHDVGEDAKIKVGPPLNGIVGKQAGTYPGFSYSAKMEELSQQGFTWTEEHLDAYLLNPRSVVPGGKMVFPGLKKEADREDVIAYLKTFAQP